ncbi:LysM peptidoglycan-binding domain-containing M23 family metallopeptidase [Streptomyces sp. SID3212]|uniref:M23 family metallopeptidase n=1 Tax=unclassified Streptomyces TaxID=2593676 RepID=UPI0013681BE3|nr:LysM peptidoglycan-binding domain-containing M23 family metallopeptidase [Streptomyces sp. SID3212]MYV52393.1 peptidoglycan DD-metalloendopeptidase family protein [Streptomyces sp. SID3212]
MPAKGKHRRPKSNPITRGFVLAGTGGAAVVLPLIGATGAHAAPAAAGSVTASPASAVHAAPASVTRAAAAKTAATYRVVSGDSLSKIAKKKKVAGGWKKLYADNKRVIGSDPSLIHPGQKLTLGAKAPLSDRAKAPTTASRSAERTAPKKAAPVKKAAPAAETAVKKASAFTLPVSGIPIGTPYHASGSNWSSGYHTGVDFLAPSGTVVKAVGAGTVVTAGAGGSYGNQVVVRHADGMYSQYAHLSSIAVSAGQTVSEGQQLGLSGATGNVTGPHLHFEIRTGPDYGSDVDPLAFLRQQGVVI